MPCQKPSSMPVSQPALPALARDGEEPAELWGRVARFGLCNPTDANLEIMSEVVSATRSLPKPELRRRVRQSESRLDIVTLWAPLFPIRLPRAEGMMAGDASAEIAQRELIH